MMATFDVNPVGASNVYRAVTGALQPDEWRYGEVRIEPPVPGDIRGRLAEIECEHEVALGLPITGSQATLLEFSDTADEPEDAQPAETIEERQARVAAAVSSLLGILNRQASESEFRRYFSDSE